MKKIWIPGAAGMLGSHFTRLLKKRRIPFVATNSREIDITHLDAVSDFVRTQKISHVINCAAYTHVDQAETEQKQAYQVNAIGTHHLGIACRRHGARIIHFSTDYVFDGKARLPYTEDYLCAPISAYGISKLAGEVKLLAEHSRSCVIRTSWLFGLFGKNFVGTMLHLMAEKEELKVVSDQIGRPTYCQDLAEATLELLEEEGIYHFANSHETTWHEFAEEIHRQAHSMGYSLKVNSILPISSHEYPTQATRPAYSSLNTKKIECKLDKAPRPWKEALADYLVEYQALQKTKNKA
ncbi:MAG: dTDP-4-dehydrorhamnose reductase [Chlamydiales bacterium]